MSSSDDDDPDYVYNQFGNRNTGVDSDVEDVDDDVESDVPEVRNWRMELILGRIKDLKEEDIGQYASGNVMFVNMTNEISSIRSSTNLNDPEAVAEKMTLYTKNENVSDVFSKFQLISEFIIHLHRVYELKFNVNSNNVDEKDQVLLETMERAIRKLYF